MLHERIARRVEIMYKDGMVEETKRLLSVGRPLSETAAQAIGYAEAIAYIEGRCTKEQAIERTVIRTRQLAKRQRTWFRHQADVAWVEVDDGMSVAEVADRVAELWSRHGGTEIRETQD
jgi:tRNA dimethylallyltransferase